MKDNEKRILIFQKNGESFSPFDIMNTAKRLSLSPVIVGDKCDKRDLQCARVLGAPLASAEKIFNTGVSQGSIVVTELPLGFLAGIMLSLPVYFYSGDGELCELSALLSPPSKLGKIFIPYSRGKVESISLPTVYPYEFSEIKNRVLKFMQAEIDSLFS